MENKIYMCAAVVQRYYFLSVVRQFQVAQGTHFNSLMEIYDDVITN
jgi:hypothetical protein